MAVTSSFQNAGESHVLELIATGRPLGEALTELAHTIEAQAEGMLCSVLVLDKDGKHLRHGAAPSLPEEYKKLIDGVAIGSCGGPCGEAAITGQPVIVTDIATDPLWKRFAAHALQHQLRACWSVPIKSSQGAVLGTVAMYHRTPRQPADADLRLIERARHLAGIAIERHLAESKGMQQTGLFQSTLLSLRDHDGDELPVFFRIVTASVAHALQIERASIWLLDASHTAIECHDIFLRSAQAHEHGQRLAAADYPCYFKAITNHDSVLADDAHTHPATSEFSASYLRPLGITSMLDVPIRTGGKLLGILCCEHVGPARRWSEEEDKFAIAVASYVTVALEQAERRRAEVALREMNQKLDHLVTERTGKLRASEARFRAIFTTEPECVKVVSRDGILLEMNTAGLAMLEVASLAEAQAQPFIDWVAHEYHGAFQHLHRAVMRGETKTLEFEVIGAKGTRRWLDTHAAPLCNEQGEVSALISVSRDVTARIQAQAEMRRLSSFAAHNPNPVLEFSAAGHVVYKNIATDKLLRRFGKQLLSEVLPPDSAALVARCLAENQNLLNVETEIDDHTLSWSFFPIPDARTVHCYGGDITERKRAETERADMERKLQETQKLESLGVLAGGIAHDFNNLLTGILGNAGLARMLLAPGAEPHRCLDQIEQSSLRAAELCTQMLAYSGRGRFVIQHLDLSALAHDMMQLLQMSISKKTVLKFTLVPNLPAISADATQLRQILMNLVINASEAIGEHSGVITVHTGLQHADAEYLRAVYPAADYLKEGNYVFLEISDNGGGMTPEVQARIFDPFFTTKFTGRGLGLAAVLGIVRGHKGALKVDSEPGRGSTFKLLLPCATGSATPVASTTATSPEWRGAGLALVVDDEESVGTVTARMLEVFGFEVVLAADGHAGLAKFKAQPDRFEIVLLDLTMPRMDGEEAFREIRRVRADARVLLMSGFNEQEVSARFLGKGLAGFIQKPFPLAVLRNKLQAILGGK